MEINIEKEAFSCTKWYTGTLTQGDIEYLFTVSTSSSEINDEYVVDIDWVNGEPDNVEEVKQEIINKFGE